MELTTGKIKLQVPAGSNAVLVKNLWLSCDPYMRTRMMKVEGHYTFPYTHAAKWIGGGRVLDSAHPDFKKGDLVQGMTGWEEYSLITETERLSKLQHTDVPLSYYTGILDMDSKVKQMIKVIEEYGDSFARRVLSSILSFG